jgi:hypothetical protein
MILLVVLRGPLFNDITGGTEGAACSCKVLISCSLKSVQFCSIFVTVL